MFWHFVRLFFPFALPYLPCDWPVSDGQAQTGGAILIGLFHSTGDSTGNDLLILQLKTGYIVIYKIPIFTCSMFVLYDVCNSLNYLACGTLGN